MEFRLPEKHNFQNKHDQRMMKPLLPFLLLSFITFFCLPSLKAQTVQITVLEGSEVRCCTDSIVKIQITPNPNGTFTEIKVDWGDGSPILSVMPGNPLIYTHTYSTYMFCGMCKNYSCSISAAINGFCNQISVFAEYSNLQPENVSKILTFKVKPEATIMANPMIPCVGDAVTFTPKICPSNDNTLTVKWTFPDGSMSTATNPTYTFTQQQNYQIQLQVLESNPVCGNGSTITTIMPLNKPDAVLTADSGVVNQGGGNYRVCLGGSSAIVVLNANNSLNELPPYMWSFTGGSGAMWYPMASPAPTTGTVRVKFTQEGIYTFTVKVNNGCDAPDMETITIEVIAAPSLALASQRDTCVAINYSPSPNVAGATYTINGAAQPTFPVMLGISPNPYIIEASLTNICANQVRRDTFFIRPPENIAILTPANNLTLCVGSPAELLITDRPGTWSGGNGHITVMNGDTLFDPAVVGNYTLVASIGAGICRRSDTLMIDVVDAAVLNLDPQPNGCIELPFTPSPFNANAIYTINGNVVSNFPVNLDTLGSPYTVTATLSNICGPSTKTISFMVDKPVPVKILAPNDTTVCSGTAVLPLLASDTVGNWVGNHITETPQGWIFSPDVAGSFTLIFERGTGDCRRADTIQVKVEPGDGVAAGPDIFLCNTLNTFTLPAGTPASGVLTGYGIMNGMIDLSTFVVDSAYQYVYTIPTLPAACNDDDFAITVTAPPSGNFTLDRDTSCVGKKVTVIPVATNGVNYEVNWGDGTTDQMLMHSYTAAGDYTIQLTVNTTNPLTGAVLCTATSSRQIHIIEPIIATNIKFSASPKDSCAVLTVTFTNLSLAEGGNYIWDFGNGQTFAGFNPPPVDFQQGVEDTVYIVSLRVSNPCDTIVFEDSIIVHPKPTAKMGLSYLQPCSGGVLKASVLSTGNPEQNVFYTSTGIVRPAVVTAPEYFQFFTDSIPQTIGIWLVTTNMCGTDTAYQEIVVNPTDVVAVIGLPDTTQLCVGEPITLINFATTGASVEWTFSDGNTYTGDTIQVTPTVSGEFHIILKVFGCGFDSVDIPFFVKPLPTLAVVHDPQQCPHLPVGFALTSDAANVTVWYGDGDSSFQKISTHIYPGPGAYQPYAQSVSAAGCVSEWTGQVIILQPPVAQVMADDSVCVDEPVSFSGMANMGTVTCTWQFGDGNVADQCDVKHPYGAPGLFYAVLTVISTEGCIDTAGIPVYVRSRPDADFDFTVQEKCTPAIVNFTSNATGATGLTWTFGDGNTSSETNPQHIYQTGQTWPVYLFATNEGICSDTALKMVPVFQTPVMDLELVRNCMVVEGADLTVYTPAENFVEVTSPGGYHLTGNFHDSLQANDYHIFIKTPEGCENDTTIVVLPVNELYLKVSRDSFSILLGDSIQLDADVNQTGVQFSWAPPAYLDDATIADPEAKPLRSVNYVVTGINLDGCVKTDTVYVQVQIDRDSSLFIPNAFSPNDDGNNDVFYVRNQYNPSISGLDMFKIFDKFGEKVFDINDLPDSQLATTENPYWGWNGVFRGQKAESGAYYYQISIRYVDGFTRLFKGTLILIR